MGRALATATRGAQTMRRLTGYERFRALRKTADLPLERAEEFARTVTLEEGKIISEARVEVFRAAETLALSAEEAKRLAGDVVPLDGAPGVKTQIGFTLRVPCGVVLAINPFNFPLHLVRHKVGPRSRPGTASS